MTKVIMVGFLAILDLTLLFGRQDGKHIDFGPSSRIAEVSATTKYSGFLVVREKKQDFYLFDKRGNQLLEVRSDVKSRKYIFSSLISEPLGLVILIGTDWEHESPVGKQQLVVRAIDIETARIRWTAYTSCIFYEISPDGMFLIPTMERIGDRGPNDPRGFHVIDLRQGMVRELPLRAGSWSSAWLDSNNAVVATNVRKQRPRSELSLQLQRAAHDRDSLRQERVYREHLLRIGDIDRPFHDAEVARLVSLIDTMQSRVDRLGKAVRQADKGEGWTVLLRVVDIRSGQVVAQAEEGSSNGRGITIPPASSLEMSTLTVEPSSGDIYLYAYAGRTHFPRNLLVKFSRGLEKQFEVPLDSCSLQKTVIGGKVLFSVLSATGESVVDCNTGQLRSADSMSAEIAGIDPKSFFGEGQARLTRRLIPGVRFSDRYDAVELQPAQEVQR